VEIFGEEKKCIVDLPSQFGERLASRECERERYLNNTSRSEEGCGDVLSRNGQTEKWGMVIINTKLLHTNLTSLAFPRPLRERARERGKTERRQIWYP
jgi:hypothetical protein